MLDVAYHHEPYWHPGQSDWSKSLLLFFDGVAILVPDYLRDRPLFTDPTLAQPLDDQGLLHRLSPETLVDQQTAEALTELLDDLLRADAFDDLDRNTAFAEISHSRLGGTADAGLTEVVLEQLRERGFARPSVDGVSIPLHPAVRAFVLVVLPQRLRTPAEAAGYALQPASTQPRTARALMDMLNLAAMPTAGHVVTADLEQVTLDLAPVPLDEVLDFRQQHGDQHRAYARNLRQFVRDAAALSQDDQQQAYLDRREALADAADELRRLAHTSWRRPLATFGLGIAGSAVTLTYGNPIGAGLTAAGALLGLPARPTRPAPTPTSSRHSSTCPPRTGADRHRQQVPTDHRHLPVEVTPPNRSDLVSQTIVYVHQAGLDRPFAQEPNPVAVSSMAS